MPRPTIRDVANLAKVSTATVSYVLNNTGSVSAETSRRVRECVEELGYRPNSVAVAHRTGRSRTIGLAVPDLTNPFFPEFSQGAHEAASAIGFSVFLLDGRSSVEVEIEGVQRLADRVPEGLIWCPVSPEDILSGRGFRFPIVVYDRAIDGLDSVCADIRHGGALQAQAIIDHGHKRIGLLTGPLTSDTARLRREGFIERLGTNAELVWEFEMEYVDDLPPETAEVITSCRDVTCVATANDLQAIRIMSLYQSSGFSIPEDISVIGFDNIDLASLVSPQLTTVNLSPRRLGERAFELLINRINNPAAPIVHDQLEVQMTLRDSVQMNASAPVDSAVSKPSQ